MKKYALVLCFLLTLSISCAYAQDKKVAIVTFYADRKVTMQGLDDAANLLKLEQDTSFNLTPLLKNYHQQFIDDYSKNFLFQIVPEAEVLNNPGYKAYYPQRDNTTEYNYRFIPFPGYQIAYFNGMHNRADLLKIFSQYDGIMFVSIYFEFQPGFAINGMGTVKMKATTQIVLVNKNDEVVFRINADETSKKTGVLVGGIPAVEPSKVLPMCESALDELMKELDKKIPKIIKKSEAKL